MPELIDLVNANGEIVEHGVLRDDAKRWEGLYMQIVVVVIFNSSGQVLVHERALTKSNGGDIDHVSGGIQAGETPAEAAARESEEEGGITPKGLRVIRKGINPYQRYCYLFLGHSDEKPGENLDPYEVAWAAYRHPAELFTARESGAMSFVDDFFDDLEFAREIKG